MSKKHSLKKSELKNIIAQGWDARRLKTKEKKEKNNKKAAEWLKKEKLGLHDPTKRRTQYRPLPPLRSTC